MQTADKHVSSSPPPAPTTAKGASSARMLAQGCLGEHLVRRARELAAAHIAGSMGVAARASERSR